MKFTVEQYAKALFDSVRETKDTSVDTVIENLISLLKANNDLAKYESIVEAYETMELEEQGIKKVHATFAHNPEEGKELIESLNIAAGKKLQVEASVDESIIGGVVLRYDDVLIDASVKGQLHKLKDTIKK